MPNILRDIRIDEVSSVDKGAGEGVRVMLMKRAGATDDMVIDFDEVKRAIRDLGKREFSQSERDSAADSGAALPDGSFPIKSKEDLKNAIQAVGRAKNRAKAMAHIKTRARALGASDMLPESWSKRFDDATLDALAKFEDAIEMETAMPFDEKAFAKSQEDIANLSKGLAGVQQSVALLLLPEDVRKFIADKDLQGDPLAKFLELKPAERAEFMKRNPFKKPKDNDGDDDDDVEKRIAKRVEDAVSDLRKQLDTANKAVITLSVKDEQASFAKRATEIGLKAEQGELLRKAASGDAAAFTELEGVIKSLNEARSAALKSARSFEELGHSGQGDGSADSALGKLNAKAEELYKAEKGKITRAQAFAKVMDDPDNAALVKAEAAERIAKISGRAAA